MLVQPAFLDHTLDSDYLLVRTLRAVEVAYEDNSPIMDHFIARKLMVIFQLRRRACHEGARRNPASVRLICLYGVDRH